MLERIDTHMHAHKHTYTKDHFLKSLKEEVTGKTWYVLIILKRILNKHGGKVGDWTSLA
jgi:hypothetical protein